MNAKDIRAAFLNFFEEKGHQIVPSAPMVIKNDPTLMFTNAGMNQFKDIFLDNTKPKELRVADTQKCLRVSGKHNDLEEVGVDTYHHTMFEMLGNWSFGEYFKQEAIAWAWELLTEVYKIDKDRLYVTVFGGDEEDGTDKDAEAYDIWKTFIEEDRILYCDKKDNFWEMGETGPAGPCSEIHVDIRDDAEREKLNGRDLVNADHPEVIEIWNLVFMQYQRMADRSLVPLTKKHIDTGMGFERLCMVIQGKKSNYDSDVFQPLIKKICALTGANYTSSPEGKVDIAIRVIADHIRAIAFSITDGQLPSNTGAGYVIRRILRRAVRYAYSFLDVRDAFMYELVSVLAEEMSDAFPELTDQKDLIMRVIKEEEESFHRTLATGLIKLDNYFDHGIKGLGGEQFAKKYVLDFEEWERWNDKVILGAVAFELKDTFGFPIDLTELIARERGWSVDDKAFEILEAQQKNRAREDRKVDSDDWVILMEDDVQEFIGYDHTESDIYITRYRKVVAKKKEQYQLVFNITPFYGESGGQVGDVGYIEDADGEKTSIKDTKKENNLIVHLADKLPDNPRKRFKARVNAPRRALIANNHTATHLLHEALREVLGTHVEQKGSLVHPDYLRFDFSHFARMTDEEIAEVELKVNARIRANIDLEVKENVPMQEAIEMGAMALFGEKYGDVVRVIRFGSSVELCGGTHVPETGHIGQFKLISEGSVAAGIRRIEAVTAAKAEKHINDHLATLSEVRALMGNPKDLPKAIQDLMDQNLALQKEMQAIVKEKAKGLKSELLNKAREVNGINFIAEKVDLDNNATKDLAYQLNGEVNNLFLVLGNENNGKGTLTVMISKNLVEERDLNAGNIIRELAKSIQGGGGGQPFFATAGGKNPAGIGEALEKAESFLM